LSRQDNPLQKSCDVELIHCSFDRLTEVSCYCCFEYSNHSTYDLTISNRNKQSVSDQDRIAL
jgi:hypothetical protein